MASILEKTEGIVLRFYDYGDTSRIVVLLTKKFGKLKVMAKGAKGKRSPFAGRLELFQVLNILFYHYPQKDLHTLKETAVVQMFPSFHEKLIAFAAANYLSELVQTAVHGEDTEGTLYQPLIQALNAVGKDGDWELALRWFETNVLQELGVMPRIKHCAVCNRELVESLRISPRHGGLVCLNCVPEDGRSLPVSSTVTGVIQFLSEVSIDKIERIKLTQLQRIELKKVLRNFLDFTLERKLKSCEFLDKLAPSTSSPLFA